MRKAGLLESLRKVGFIEIGFSENVFESTEDAYGTTKGGWITITRGES